MKNLTLLALFALNSSLLSAAVPLRWTVETSAANPATFDQFSGATYDLEATLQSRGKPLAVSGEAQLFWQTNGMGTAWWTAPATVSGNVLRATWTPACDVGAKVYNCFIGITGTVYNAAFQLRLRPSPGAVPNALPLPTPVIDFSRVAVLNPPWTPGGGSGGTDTNDVRAIAREEIGPATNRLYKTLIDARDGSARYLPKYLWLYDCDDSYPDDAAWYYAQPQQYGSCSAVRDGGFLSRNYDWKFDDAAEFVVRMSAGQVRFASVGVANCGTNLTEELVTSGKPSRYYKCLPSRTVDGINENGVVCEVNVVDGDPHDHWPTNGVIHCMGVVRWTLDHATDAGTAARYLVEHVFFPPGFAQNLHWMIADESSTYIVENGACSNITGRAVMTNFPLIDRVDGMGLERYNLLVGGESITNVWFTRAYSRATNWESEFKDADEMEAAKSAWETYGREELRGNGLWQTVHTSVYDITNRTLRVAVQETDDWYTFAVPSGGSVNPESVRAIVDDAVGGTNAVKDAIASVSGLAEKKADRSEISETNATFAAAVYGSTTNLFRTFGDEYVYVPSGFSDFTWHGDRRDAVAAIGDMQPTQVDSVGGYTSWVIAFEMDEHYYWGDAYALTAAPEVMFSFYSDWYDESTGEWMYDSLELTAVRHVTGYHRTNPIDTFARQSRLEAVAGSVDGLRNRIDGETKVLRTGADGERGSGWGYLQTSLDGDYRNWRFRVPEWIGVTGSTTNDTTASQTYVTWTNGNQRSVGYSVILKNPLSWSAAWSFDRTVKETRGAQGGDAVQQADYDVGILKKSQTVSGGSTYFLNYTVSQNGGMDVKTSLVEHGWTETNRVYWLGSGGSGTFVTVPGYYRPINEHITRTWTYGHGDGYEDVATFEADATGLFVREDDLVDTYVTSPSFKFSVVCETERVTVVRTPEDGEPETLLDETINWAYHSVDISAQRISSTTFEDAFAPYYKLVGTLDYGIFYDEEKDCSWQIKVKNGCFFQDKYCDGDWRK